MELFGVPNSGPDSAGIVATLKEPGTCQLSGDNLRPIDVSYGLIPETQFQLERFLVRVCTSAHQSAAQVTSLRIRAADGTRPTVGMVFPISALRNEQGLTDEYTLIYGDAAARAIFHLPCLHQFQSAKRWEDLSSSTEVGLDDLFDERLSVVCLSNDVLLKHNVNDGTAFFLLRRHGYFICEDSGALHHPPADIEYKDAINLTLPKTNEPDDIVALHSILMSADRDVSAIGRFIQLYQFLEYMIDRVFSWSVPVVANFEISPWEMRTALGNLGNELKRLHMVDQHCVPTIQSRVAQARLRDACALFLAAVEEKHEKNAQWQKLLYLSRNKVVHDQMNIHRRNCLEQLSALNSALREVVLDLILHFEKPGDCSCLAKFALEEQTAQPDAAASEDEEGGTNGGTIPDP